MNREHIIPLSLGGADGFEIMVDSCMNAIFGSDIDGALANDFLTSFDRMKHDSKGHSRKAPFPRAKHSRLSSSGKPVSISFKKGKFEVFSPIDKRILNDHEWMSEQIQSTIKFDPYLRVRFTAKVALSAGYFIYKDLFKNNVNHDEIRKLANFDPQTAKRSDYKNTNLRGWFWPFPIEEKDRSDYELYQFLATYLNCSFVLAIPGESSLGLIVGLLGKVVGILNFPAQTENFPTLEEHDLGHLVSLKNNTLTTMSYRELVTKAATDTGLLNVES